MSTTATRMKLIVLASFFPILILGGCSKRQETASESIIEGIATLQSVTQTLKTDLSVNDQNKIKQDALNLEEAWDPFEDNVKSLYPEYYAKVEDYLDPIIAGTQVDKPDEKILTELNNHLIQTLKDLAQKNNAKN